MSAEESEVSAEDVERGVTAREYIQFLIDRALAGDQETDPNAGLYELIFDSGIGLVRWVRTAEELLQANGSEPLVAWMLRETEIRGAETFRLAKLPYDGGVPGVDYRGMAEKLVQEFLPMAAEHPFDIGERDLAELEELIGWVTALSDAAHATQDELVALQFGLVQRVKREAERGGKRG